MDHKVNLTITVNPRHMDFIKLCVRGNVSKLIRLFLDNLMEEEGWLDPGNEKDFLMKQMREAEEHMSDERSKIAAIKAKIKASEKAAEISKKQKKEKREEIKLNREKEQNEKTMMFIKGVKEGGVLRKLGRK